jgi:hypothetical protein
MFPMRPLTTVEKSQAPLCVDGRAATHNETGPKMLGGSLHIVLLWCLWHAKTFEAASIQHVFELLKNHGFGIGVHRGSNKNAKTDLSDCGFADNLPAIIEQAALQKTAITESVIKRFPEHIGAHDMTHAWNKIITFPRGAIAIWGEDCIATAIAAGAHLAQVHGQHHEEAAVVNIETNTTLDAIKQNKLGHQAFDLDLWMIRQQCHALSLPDEFAITASLALYVATEIILVERKGKKALAVEVV